MTFQATGSRASCCQNASDRPVELDVSEDAVGHLVQFGPPNLGVIMRARAHGWTLSESIAALTELGSVSFRARAGQSVMVRFARRTRPAGTGSSFSTG